MNRRLEFHPGARREAIDAALWYARVRFELGTAFLEELEYAQGKIQEGPERWQEIGRGFRRYVMNRFPYLIVYRVTRDRIQIIAVAHGNRRPFYWRHRR
jgi:toxin ParE1/3/4